MHTSTRGWRSVRNGYWITSGGLGVSAQHNAVRAASHHLRALAITHRLKSENICYVKPTPGSIRFDRRNLLQIHTLRRSARVPVWIDQRVRGPAVFGVCKIPRLA